MVKSVSHNPGSSIQAKAALAEPAEGTLHQFTTWKTQLSDGISELLNAGAVDGEVAAPVDLRRLHTKLGDVIQEYESVYASLFDNMLNGLAYCRMIFDGDVPVDFVYLNVNAAFVSLTGLKDVVGKKASVAIPGIRESDPHLFEIYGRVARTGKPERFEFYVKALQHWFLLSVYSPHADHFVAVFDLITERKRGELEQQISAVAFEAQEAIMITDAAGVILRVNQAFVETTGYSAEEMVGQTPNLLKSGRHDDSFYEEMWASLRLNGLWQGEIWDRRKNGQVYPKWLNIRGVRGIDGVITHYVASHTDITDRKEAEERIKNLAFYDFLTHLPNRRLLMNRLQHTLAVSARSSREGALLFIDLDHFKTLNDTHGHKMGDELLKEVALRLCACIRDVDTVARLGGDEFIVLLDALSENPKEAAAQAKDIGEKILCTIGQPYLIAGKQYSTTPSIGITLFGDQRRDMEELLKQGDIAMYQAKAAGRNTMRFFDPELQAIIKSRARLEEELRVAISRNQFLLYYQPQVEGERVIGAEALIRWRHPERGMVSPIEFIPLAEETGLILSLGHWVLEAACIQIAAWANRAEMAHISLAVNVSAKQFHQPGFVEQVLSVIEHTGADPHKLKLELTESMLIDNVEDIIAKMTTLKSRGLQFSLDDFGTGYSSLSYLKRLPLCQLKIDQSFVMDVLTDPNDAAIARTVIALGQSLGLKVLAEGVETEGQREFLASYGCHTYQGYLFSRPVAIDEFEKLLEIHADV